MTSPKIPDRSLGGTFVYEKDGTFVRHDPPTAPIEPPSIAEDSNGASDEPAPASSTDSPVDEQSDDAKTTKTRKR
ncbi:MAG: hypothetical protein J0I77_09320 [Rudaea sp.]|uniref:hypothetical protein n=1 Tax=unclassified Rudaea TaxID=2627037 RepID=UPI0010F90F3E|nr:MULTISPECIES: hypothetical protein [unclassified Rudaea]MBN8885906.1 hypothetical protein [Rudaea sp.]MBR0346979.1 hypothetical protein [Rudaea sp.]